MQLDKKDKKIIETLKEHGNWGTNQISKKTKVPITTVHNRIKKLNKEEIIKKYNIKLNNKKIGKSVKAHILITVNQNKNLPQEQTAKKVKQIEDITSVDIVTGETDMIATIQTESIDRLNEIITKEIRNIEGIDKTKTIIVLNEI